MLWSNCLDLDGALEGLGLLCGLGVGLSAHDATTPVTLGLLVLLHVALLDGLDECKVGNTKGFETPGGYNPGLAGVGLGLDLSNPWKTLPPAGVPPTPGGGFWPGFT